MYPVDYFKTPPYALPQDQKEQLLVPLLNTLTAHHRRVCSDYSKLLDLFHPQMTSWNALGTFPYLPVGLFKQRNLMSIPHEEVFKVLQSSGTTGSTPSKIYLDRETAKRQTIALASIMSSFLGKKRLPMLIIDTPSVIKDRQSFSARGAGILGMLNFGRDHLYVLDDEMQLKREELFRWLEDHENKPILLFGFTFIVWQYFLKALKPGEISLPNSRLIHSGGWKKLEDEKVGGNEFKKMLSDVADIPNCHNFYGMVEQVGSVFMECQEGQFHCPHFAEVIVRDPNTWKEAAIGETGVIQVISTLPTSYPGHSLLTEDLGVVTGVDNCPCGRLGKTFQILGRVPQTELRGCSNTFEEEKR